MRTFPVSPAQMQTHRLMGYVTRSVVEDRETLGDLLAKLWHRPPLATRPRAGKVGAVELEDQASLVDRVILVLHGVCERDEILFGARIIPIWHKHIDYAWRRSCQKGLRDGGLPSNGSSQVRDVGVHRREVEVGHRAIAAGPGGCYVDELRELLIAPPACGD